MSADGREKEQVSLGSDNESVVSAESGLLLADMMSCDGRDRVKYAREFVRRWNALSGLDPAALGGLLEAVRAVRDNGLTRGAFDALCAALARLEGRDGT